MEKLTYSIQLNRDGVVKFQAIVPALESGIVGDYHNHKPYQPDSRAIFERLPWSYRKAFERALKWWREETYSGHSVPLMCELRSTKGESMGTLFATPNWEA